MFVCVSYKVEIKKNVFKLIVFLLSHICFFFLFFFFICESLEFYQFDRIQAGIFEAFNSTSR